MSDMRCPVCEGRLEPLPGDPQARRHCVSCGRQYAVAAREEPEPAPVRRRRFDDEDEPPYEERAESPEEAERRRKRLEEDSRHHRRLFIIGCSTLLGMSLLAVLLFRPKNGNLVEMMDSPFEYAVYAGAAVTGFVVAVADRAYKRKRKRGEEEDRERHEVERYDVPPRRDGEDNPWRRTGGAIRPDDGPPGGKS